MALPSGTSVGSFSEIFASDTIHKARGTLRVIKLC